MIYLTDHKYNILYKLNNIKEYNIMCNDCLTKPINVSIFGRCFLHHLPNYSDGKYPNNPEYLGYIIQPDLLLEDTDNRSDMILGIIKAYEREQTINELI